MNRHVWLVACHQSLTGDSTIEAFASLNAATARFKQAYEEDCREMGVQPYSGEHTDYWHEDLSVPEHLWYWADNGDTQFFVAMHKTLVQGDEYGANE